MADSKYDITAKIPPDTSNEDFKLMLQHLLAERIGLVVHHEAQEQTVYELGIAKGGLKMRQAEPAPANEPPSDPTASADGKPPTIHLVTDKDGNQQLPPGHPMSIVTGVGGVIRRMARMEEMPQVVRMLEQRAGHPVIDKTGLTGQYDFVLEFAPDTPAARPMDLSAAAPAEASTPAPFFFDAVVQQLGLKLEPKKASVDVLIVDSFNKVPTEN